MAKVFPQRGGLVEAFSSFLGPSRSPTTDLARPKMPLELRFQVVRRQGFEPRTR